MKNKKLSVVMSCWNRGNCLGWSLQTLIDQEIPPDEIIVIDDGSVDETKFVVRRFQQVHPEANVKYYYNNNPDFTMCAWGLNCGIKKATNEIIMLTMPEILHPTSDVKIILEHFQDPENDKTYLVGRPMYFVYGWDLVGKINRENFRNPIAITQRPEVRTWHKDLVSKEGMITYFPRGGLHHIMGIPKKHLLAVGGFDERFSEPGYRGWEDIDLFTRLAAGFYGLKEIESFEIIGIHLFHTKPFLTDEDFIGQSHNYEILKESGYKHQWKVNVGREWGVLKK